jgi:predicted membrane chloride channel (bestrophin family)
LLEGVAANEIVYLKQNSLDEKKQILTVSDATDTKKQIHVSTACVDRYQAALKQTKYLHSFGNQPHQGKLTDLRKSPYLIKMSMSDYLANRAMITELDSVILRTIYMRLRRLAEYFSLPELTHLTTVKLELKELVHV